MDFQDIVAELDRRFALPLREYARRRLIFWQDPDGEFADEIAGLQLARAKVLVLTGHNAFLAKKTLSHDDLASNYLVYVPFAYGSLEDDWLLDLELAGESFRADLISIWMQELGVPDEQGYRDLMKRYRKFFGAQERRRRLAALTGERVTPARLMLAMMAVVTRSASATPGDILRAVLMGGGEAEENEAYAHLAAYDLTGVFWSMVRQALGYAEQEASLSRLLLYLFVTAARRVLPERAFREVHELCGEGFAAACFDLVSEWMHGTRRAKFRPVAAYVERTLNLVHRLGALSVEELGTLDLFPCVDDVIVARLLRDAEDRLLQPETVAAVIERRRATFWYDDAAVLYDALAAYGQMLAFAAEHAAGFHLTQAREVWAAYTEDYYRMDASYRHFRTAFDRLLQRALPAGLDDAFKQLAVLAEDQYATGFLAPLGENWTKTCAAELAADGRVRGVAAQASFYRERVAPAGSRVFVVISDAMRYEVAAELAEELHRALPSEVALESCQAALPSVTRLGMAALLPQRALSVKVREGGVSVLADGMSTEAPNREAVLQAANPKSCALRAADLLAMKRAERAALVRGREVVYIYHDTIDTASHADDRKVFPACREAIDELKSLVRIIVNEFSGTHVLLTADHGFLYTAEPLAEDSKAGSGLARAEIIELARRYVLTTPDATAPHLLPVRFLPGEASARLFVPREQIRLKVKGSGMNFVHGGISLQEMVVPVLEFRHVRSDSAAYRRHSEQYALRPVRVQLLNSGHKVSNLQFALDFYQVEAVGSGCVPAEYEAYFTDAAGHEISDVQRLIADKVSQEPTERTFRCAFHLKAGAYDRTADYYLLIAARDSGEIIQKVPFTIDTSYERDAFDFSEV